MLQNIYLIRFLSQNTNWAIPLMTGWFSSSVMFSFLAACLKAWVLNLGFMSLSPDLPFISSGLRLDWYTSWWFLLCLDCYSYVFSAHVAILFLYYCFWPPTVWPWISYLIHLCVSFLNWGVKLVSISLRSCEN